MSRSTVPATPAIRMLRQAKIEYSEHLYDYEEKGGTAVAARKLGIDEHATVKTLVMEDDRHTPLLVLMHGDWQVSTKELARALGVKTVSPCTPETAAKHTGYMVGGTSPFGTRKQLPIYLEATIPDLPTLYINAGKRGFLVEISPRVIMDLLNPVLVKVGYSP
jgi:Cys-tRNA(Pro) deacylase